MYCVLSFSDFHDLQLVFFIVMVKVHCMLFFLLSHIHLAALHSQHLMSVDLTPHPANADESDYSNYNKSDGDSSHQDNERALT